VICLKDRVPPAPRFCRRISNKEYEIQKTLNTQLEVMKLQQSEKYVEFLQKRNRTGTDESDGGDEKKEDIGSVVYFFVHLARII